MAHQERLLAREAEREFSTAFAKMQPTLPVIDENGAILGPDGEPVATYATWEDTVEAIRPVLARHGFSLSFVPGRSPNGHPTVTGVLRHRGGHKEVGELELPPDPTAGKNAVQAIGSALSYGQRYVARMLLSLTSRGGDDDARSATRSPEAFDAIVEIEAAPDAVALAAWKRRSRGRLAALPPGDLKSVVGRYVDRRRHLGASRDEVRS
jgi:ERF superfamily